ncbi:MAG: hypothetical protein KIS30_07450 [Thermoplasmata archaeon]|nr:hypothetical protein [Candidatus Sysuiplasma acidicola]MBX8646574.1 hypothetical protein [Candidatus Sysuiplasma acidicola]MDH2906441.1 hypothetical protein [Methanomassiliicoccales archaeon]
MVRSMRDPVLMLPSIAMTVAVPALAFYFMTRGLDIIAGTVIIVFAIIGAIVLGVVGIGVSSEVEHSSYQEELESLKILRASHRAMLEEMDELVSMLGHIKNTLSPEKRDA